MEFELTIWDHPENAQPVKRQTLMRVRGGDQIAALIERANDLGFRYTTEIGGRYMFNHPAQRDVAVIAAA